MVHTYTKTSSSSNKRKAETGKQKRNRKDKIGKVLLRIKQMAVQHKVAIPVNCELTARRDGVQRLIVVFFN